MSKTKNLKTKATFIISVFTTDPPISWIRFSLTNFSPNFPLDYPAIFLSSVHYNYLNYCNGLQSAGIILLYILIMCSFNITTIINYNLNSFYVTTNINYNINSFYVTTNINFNLNSFYVTTNIYYNINSFNIATNINYNLDSFNITTNIN